MSTSKQLWLLAGGNGSGKTTFYEQYLKPIGLAFVNADILAKQLDAHNTEAMSYQAAKLTAQLRRHLLKSGTSFCFETVFSHPSKIDFLADAKTRGYEIILVYIHLNSIELNLARISQRVKSGGHNVPENKVISRIPRTMQYIRDALPLADTAKLFDNSLRSKPFKSIAYLHNGKLETQTNPLPDWAEKMLADYR